MTGNAGGDAVGWRAPGRSRWLYLIAGALSFAMTSAAYWICGRSLDTSLCGLAVGALVVPAFTAVAWQKRGAAAWLIPLISTIASGGFGCLAARRGDGSLAMAIKGFLVALSAAWCAAAVTVALMAVSVPRVLAVFGATVAAVAWLTLPVWVVATPFLDSGWVRIHPIFAINGIFPRLGIWTEQQVAYRLTPLGQDVGYTLPTAILPALEVHVGVAVFLLVLSYLADRREAHDVELTSGVAE